MSYYITEHRCIICNGWYEVWEHNESEEQYIHTTALKNKLLNPICVCKPLPDGMKNL